MEKTYFVIVQHYATPEIIRTEHHLTFELAVVEARKALDEGYPVVIGID